MNARLINTIWCKVVVPTYKEYFDKGPERTAIKIASEIGIDPAMEIFATIAKIKSHDGRIYGKNREIMNSIPTNPDADYTRINMLDEIHPTHINQLITELIKLESEGKFK